MKLQYLLRLVEPGVDGLRGNALRTALSTVGVVIGVASLVGVLALGDGMERYVRDSISKEKVQVVRVSPRTTREVEGRRVPVRDRVILTEHDLAQVRELPGVADVTLQIGGIADYRAGRWRGEGITTIAVLANSVEFDYLDLLHGRFFLPAEASRDMPVLVVSLGLAKKIAGSSPYPTVLDSRVWVGDSPRRVIGIYASDEEAAYVPLRAARDLFDRWVPAPAPQMLVRARSVEGVQPVRVALEDWAALRFGPPEERFNFSTYADRIEQAAQGIAVFKLIMGAIIGISLLVGGIGVMNVLLASVAERTREIGLRRALGAHRRDILAQFLFESLAITGLGSLIGIVMGSVGAMAMSPLVRSLTGQAIFVSPTLGTVLMALACPALVGLVFGIYPARRAAQLSPIDALRHE